MTIIFFFENSSISLYGCFMAIVLRKFLYPSAGLVFMAALWLLSSVNFLIRALDVFLLEGVISEMLKLLVILLVGSFEDVGWC